jgi:hypothetical protein
MRKEIEKAYQEARVIITYGYGFEFRKNPLRKGKFFWDEPTHYAREGSFIWDSEFDEINRRLFPSGKGITSQIENKNFCVSYCSLFKTCDKNCTVSECKRRQKTFRDAEGNGYI